MTKILLLLTSVVLLATSTLHARAEERPPMIKHQAVTVAVQGQPIAVRATVTDDVDVKTVTLNYTTSRDAAPARRMRWDKVNLGNFSINQRRRSG